MRRRRLPIILVALALVSGCTAPHLGTTKSPTSNRLVFEHGGTVVVAVSSLPSNFNPSAPEGANRITTEVMAQVWPQTFVTNDKLASTVEEGFVDQAEVEGVSPFKVVYTLNPKAVWSDGVPIGVQDFVYNWHEQLAYGSQLPDSGLLAGYQAISSITSPNGGSIVVVMFSHPFTEWESLFSNLVPAHIGERYGWVNAFDGLDPAKVVSGGPFEITSFVPGVSLVLSRNPRYWFTPARLSRIVLEVQSTPAALANLQVGLVNIAQVPESGSVAVVVANAARRGIPLTRETSNLPTLWELCFNTTAPLVDAEQFRLGIAESLYPSEVTDESVGLIDSSATPYDSRLILGASSGSAALGGSSGSGSAAGGTGTSSVGDYDPAAAIQSFGSAGYVTGPDGALRAGGTGALVTLSLLVPTGDVTVEQAASVVQAQLSAVGIRVVLRPVQLNTMLSTALPTGDYQMALAPFSLTTFAAAQAPIYSDSVLPALTTSPPVHRSTSSAGAAGAGTNAGATGVEPGALAAGFVTRDVSGVDDPIVTTDLSDALTNLDPGADVNLINAADNELWADVPTIPLFQESIDLLHSSAVRAVSESATWAGVFWNAQAWEIQESPPILAR